MFPEKRCCWETFSFWESEHWWHEDFIFLGKSIFIYFQGLRLRWTSIVHLRVDSTGLYVKEVDLLSAFSAQRGVIFLPRTRWKHLYHPKLSGREYTLVSITGILILLFVLQNFRLKTSWANVITSFFWFLRGWGFIGGGIFASNPWIPSWASKTTVLVTFQGVVFHTFKDLGGRWSLCLTCVFSWIKKEWLISPQSYGIHKKHISK